MRATEVNCNKTIQKYVLNYKISILIGKHISLVYANNLCDSSHTYLITSKIFNY